MFFLPLTGKQYALPPREAEVAPWDPLFIEVTEKGLPMTPRGQFIAALERRPILGRVPHFELAFYLTMEVFGRIHPRHRNYQQWDQMQEEERALHAADLAGLYIAIAERYEHSAILLDPNPMLFDIEIRVIDEIRERTGDRYFLMVHNDPTFAIPSGDRMSSFCSRIADEPEKLKAEAEAGVREAVTRAERFLGARRS